MSRLWVALRSIVYMTGFFWLWAVVVRKVRALDKLIVEEPGLRKRFGREYEEYCKTVPRWVPRLSPTQPPT